MLIRIDESSSVPIYAQVAAAVRRAVVEGRAASGDRLPPARDLADALGVNLHTVLRGYQELRDEGLLDLRRGRGAVIAAGAVERAAPRLALREFVDEARRHGLSVEEAVALVREGMTS